MAEGRREKAEGGRKVEGEGRREKAEGGK
jgi:hypothetical protein